MLCSPVGQVSDLPSRRDTVSYRSIRPRRRPGYYSETNGRFWKNSRVCWFESKFKAEVRGGYFQAINAGGLIALLIGFGPFIHVGVPPTDQTINQYAVF